MFLLAVVPEHLPGAPWPTGDAGTLAATGTRWPRPEEVLVLAGLFVLALLVLLHLGSRELERERTRRRGAERALIRRDRYDPVTGLMNRQVFLRRVERSLQQSSGGSPVSLLLVDVDDFTILNDRLGHDRGDQVLHAVAERLSTIVEPAASAGRLGSDEFGVLVREQNPLELAARVRRELQAALPPEAEEAPITATCGLATSTGDASSAEELLQEADLALAEAKRCGRNTLRRYRPSLHRQAVRRGELSADLPQAVERGQLHLHYQPICHIPSGRALGVEVLSRWLHPTLGLVGPAEFIPLMEETGVIVPFTDWLLKEACGAAATWPNDAFVSVNVSARSLSRSELPAGVAGVLAATGLPPARLMLEVTESGVTGQPERAARVLEQLSGTGVRLALDDFGTGYNCLSRLADLPVDVVKLDKSYIGRLESDPAARILTTSILRLAGQLGMTTVAEGVERPGQADWLRRAGCRQAQGYLFGRPLPPRHIRRLLTVAEERHEREKQRRPTAV